MGLSSCDLIYEQMPIEAIVAGVGIYECMFARLLVDVRRKVLVLERRLVDCVVEYWIECRKFLT